MINEYETMALILRFTSEVAKDLQSKAKTHKSSKRTKKK